MHSPVISKSAFQLVWTGQNRGIIYRTGELVATIEVVSQKNVYFFLPLPKKIRAADVHIKVLDKDPDAPRKVSETIRFLMSPFIRQTLEKNGVWGYSVLIRNPHILRQIVKRYPFQPVLGELLPQADVHRIREILNPQKEPQKPSSTDRLSTTPIRLRNKPFVSLGLSFSYYSKWNLLSSEKRRATIMTNREFLEMYIAMELRHDINDVIASQLRSRLFALVKRKRPSRRSRKRIR